MSEFRAGQIVRIKGDKDKTHKMIVALHRAVATLEWWSFSGPETENVPVDALIYVSEEPTPEFTSARTLWTAARDKHHETTAAQRSRERADQKKRRPKKYKISTVPNVRFW